MGPTGIESDISTTTTMSPTGIQQNESDIPTTTTSPTTESSPTGIQVDMQTTTTPPPSNSSNDLQDALRRADERMSRIEKKLKEESENLRGEAEEAKRRQAERQKLEEMRRAKREKLKKEATRKIREKQILMGLTQFREHVLSCLKVLRGGANDLYYTILRTLSNIPASKVCMVFKQMEFPRYPMHGFTQQMEHFSIEADESGAVEMYLDGSKRGIFQCMCERNPLVGSHIAGAPVIVNRTLAIMNRRSAPDMDAIVAEFEAAVKNDVEKIDPTGGKIGPALVEGQ